MVRIYSKPAPTSHALEGAKPAPKTFLTCKERKQNFPHARELILPPARSPASFQSSSASGQLKNTPLMVKEKKTDITRAEAEQLVHVVAHPERKTDTQVATCGCERDHRVSRKLECHAGRRSVTFRISVGAGPLRSIREKTSLNVYTLTSLFS